jgi:hypothetical protein
MAQILIIVGSVIVGLGVLLWLAPWLFTWFGNLPGDINYQTENVKVFIPITSMLVLSIVGSTILTFFRR